MFLRLLGVVGEVLVNQKPTESEKESKFVKQKSLANQ